MLSVPRRYCLGREDYGQIILECGVHCFNYESFQTRTELGRSHSCNVIFMIFKNVLNRVSFLLSRHAVTYNARFRASNTKIVSHHDAVATENWIARGAQRIYRRLPHRANGRLPTM